MMPLPSLSSPRFVSSLMFSLCVLLFSSNPVLTIAAFLSYRPPFVMPMEHEKAALTAIMLKFVFSAFARVFENVFWLMVHCPGLASDLVMDHSVIWLFSFALTKAGLLQKNKGDPLKDNFAGNTSTTTRYFFSPSVTVLC